MIKIELRIIIILISIVFIIAALSLITIRAVNDIHKLSSAISNERFSLEEEYKSGQNLRKTQAAIKRAEDLLNEFGSIFSSKEDPLRYVTKLEQEAQRYNLDLTLDLPGGAILPETKKYVFMAATEGTFQNTLAYLRGLERLPSIIVVKNILIDRLDESKGTVMAKFLITINNP